MVKQGSDEWLEQRRGKFTASEIHKLMGTRGFGKTGETYILSKVSEILSGEIDEIADNKNFLHGRKYEPIARKIYEAANGCKTELRDFVPWAEEPESGASPDALVPSLKRGLEIKCPRTKLGHTKHLRIFAAATLKKYAPEYYWQVQMCLLVFPEAESWDFASYNEAFNKSGLGMWIAEIERVESDQIMLMQRIGEAVGMRDEILKNIKNR